SSTRTGRAPVTATVTATRPRTGARRPCQTDGKRVLADLVFVSCVALLYFLAWRRPGVACGYVLSSYALEQFAQAFVPLAGRNDVLCNYLIAFAVVIAVARRIMRDGLGAIRFRAPSLLFLLLLGYCYATVLWSIFPETTSRLLNAQVPYMVVFVGLAPLAVN